MSFACHNEDCFMRSLPFHCISHMSMCMSTWLMMLLLMSVLFLVLLEHCGQYSVNRRASWSCQKVRPLFYSCIYFDGIRVCVYGSSCPSMRWDWSQCYECSAAHILWAPVYKSVSLLQSLHMYMRSLWCPWISMIAAPCVSLHLSTCLFVSVCALQLSYRLSICQSQLTFQWLSYNFSDCLVPDLYFPFLAALLTFTHTHTL